MPAAPAEQSRNGPRLTSSGLLSNTHTAAIKQMKFGPEFDTKVDMRKVELAVMKPWIAKRTTELLNGMEDEVLIEYISSLLEDAENPVRRPSRALNKGSAR